jgi:hypothetical protein
MNLTRWIIPAGFAGTVLAVVVSLLNHKRFEQKDVALGLGGFMAAANFPPSIYLCLYAVWPDEALARTRIAGYEWYLFLAGLAAFLFGVQGFVAIVKQAKNG